MIKILHTADWHLDSPLQGKSPEQTQLLRRELLALPGKISALCKQEGCQLVLISGDIFDGAYTADSLTAVKNALEEMAVPVFIAPGNHDFVGLSSPWLTEKFPANAYIFTKQALEEVYIPELDLHVYGAGFTSMDCPGLLEGFHAPANSIAVLHGDPTQTASPYCPITQTQVLDSGLQYLALGHIHKGGQFKTGNTLCAWPGCPMGRGYDEQGEKGVLIATLSDTVTTRFIPLNTPKFFDLETTPAGLDALLPPVGNDDFYRITFTGESDPIDLPALCAAYSRFPNLELRDRTTVPVDVWKSVGEDSFEGTYFGLLQDALAGKSEAEQQKILLTARICRQILDGQEVVLP